MNLINKVHPTGQRKLLFKTHCVLSCNSIELVYKRIGYSYIGYSYKCKKPRNELQGLHLFYQARKIIQLRC
ncbi:hypothetical protein C9426_06055 [Serratia sp. S1B]|nr:hypothetical protein C9426_06055 [Serratia sp. S1B]